MKVEKSAFAQCWTDAAARARDLDSRLWRSCIALHAPLPLVHEALRGDMNYPRTVLDTAS